MSIFQGLNNILRGIDINVFVALEFKKKKTKLQRPNQEATWSINKLIFIIDYLKIDITKNNLGCHLE